MIMRVRVSRLLLPAITAVPLFAQSTLLFTQNDIRQLREAVKSQLWAKDLSVQLTQESDEWPAAHVRQFGLSAWSVPSGHTTTFAQRMGFVFARKAARISARSMAKIITVGRTTTLRT